MNQDGGLPFDLDEVFEVIDSTDVLVIGFPLFPERLMADFRTKEDAGPMIRVVAPVASRAERLRDLQRLRPGFGMPSQHVFFVWPRSLASLRQSGIWDQMLARCGQDSRPDVTRQAEQAMSELRQLERRALSDAISGENYQSLWERSA